MTDKKTANKIIKALMKCAQKSGCWTQAGRWLGEKSKLFEKHELK